ncbi:MAG: FAD-linked oxidase C-terminal domain-containing protein, partial [Pseudomonadota bacterium]
YNLFPPKGSDKAQFSTLKDAMTEIVHDRVHALGGSFSAEHGVGRLKRDELASLRPKAATEAMIAIKRALDPNNLLNPGRVIDAG